MSVQAKKCSALCGAVAVVLAAASGAWLWLGTARAQNPEAPPFMECPVVAAGVVANLGRVPGQNAVVGQVAIGTASAGGVDAHFGAIPCLVQNCGDAPFLKSVCPSLVNPKPDRYVYPGAPSTGGIDAVEILLNGPVNLDGLICVKSTGSSPPASAALVGIDPPNGLYEIVFSSAIELAEWTTAVMTLTNACGVTEVCVHVGWQSGDIDQNGQTNINDANAFGVQFNLGVNADLKLADLNDDGGVNINDASLFGQCWNGNPPAEAHPDGGGWEGTGLGPVPDCICP